MEKYKSGDGIIVDPARNTEASILRGSDPNDLRLTVQSSRGGQLARERKLDNTRHIFAGGQRPVGQAEEAMAAQIFGDRGNHGLLALLPANGERPLQRNTRARAALNPGFR